MMLQTIDLQSEQTFINGPYNMAVEGGGAGVSSILVRPISFIFISTVPSFLLNDILEYPVLNKLPKSPYL